MALWHVACSVTGESYNEGASMEPDNHTLRLLIEMRAEMRESFDAVKARFDGVDARFDAMDRRFDVAEDIARDTAARVRMQGRMLRNLDSSKRKHSDRIDAIERKGT